MSAELMCPHCTHPWNIHGTGEAPYFPRCSECDCMWQLQKTVEAHVPTAQELLNNRVEVAIYRELDRQAEGDEIEGAGYWDREWGRLDGEPDWSLIAAAAASAALEKHRAFVTALIARTYRGICPVCSYLWDECECGVVDVEVL